MKDCLGNSIGTPGTVAKICIQIPTWQSGTNKEGVTIHYGITGWARMKAREQSGMPLRQMDGKELSKKCKQKLEPRQPHSQVSPHILLSTLDTLSRGKGLHCSMTGSPEWSKKNELWESTHTHKINKSSVIDQDGSLGIKLQQVRILHTSTNYPNVK